MTDTGLPGWQAAAPDRVDTVTDGGRIRRSPIWRGKHRYRSILALAAVAVAGAGTVLVAAPAALAATSVTINGSSGGRTFDGVGAISGGGGNSRLLIDYAEPQRTQILDYLFKPGVGAAVQILKVEVGGDTNSTSGAEPSHEHTRGAINCDRGYEWWLAEQAKTRNPNIKLYGLAWGAPGWIGNGNFWSTDSVNYLVDWLDCAKTHGLSFDYLGGWNEKGRNLSWYENLRSTLDSRGYTNVKLVASDEFGFAAADDALRDANFSRAVAVFGAHYVCGYRSSQSSCPSSNNAISTGKPLWASENGSDDYNGGAQALARGINRGYLDGKMTAYINWPIIAAITPNIPWATMGVAVAAQPWSGNYSIGKNTWVMAQTTQFTAPGWQYLDGGSGYLGGNRNNGSYVTLKAPNNSDYSTVVETMDATAAQSLTFSITGGLSTGAVHVWSTDVNSNNPADYMVHSGDLTPSGGSYTLTVQPGRVYTITTTTGQGKGTATSPGAHGLALPYTDNFDSYPTGHEARYLMDMQGAFESVACGGGRTGQCVRQMSEQAPIKWTDQLAEPYALLGDVNWGDYTVATDVMLEKSGYAQLIGHAGGYPHESPANLDAYYLRVADNGAWSIQANNTSGQQRTLTGGTTTALGTGRWHTIALKFSGTTITATLDGTTLGSTTDSAHRNGQVGYATGQGVTAQFDNLVVYSGSTPPSPSPTPSASSASPTPSASQASPTPSASSASPTPSASSPSPSASPSTPSTGGTCAATYTITSHWPNGFQGQVDVTNKGTSTSTGWSVTFTFADGQQITQSWGGTVTQNGATVTARNASWNGALPAGGSASVGFLASWNNNSNTIPAVSCTLS